MKRFIAIPLILIAFSLSAAPIGEQKARDIASKFFAKSATRSSSVVLKMEWAGSDLEAATSNNSTTRSSATDNEEKESLVYIYNRIDTRGFVVIAGDDKVKQSILAFSHDNNFNMEDMPDGAKAILQGWCEQVAATRANKNIRTVTRAEDSDTGDVVVKYETAKWAQGKPYNTYCPKHDGKGTLTGCVATAAGIICRYFEWPEKGEGTTPSYTHTDQSVEYTVPENVLGRTYDYSKMKMSYKDGYTEEEGQMVGALLYDIGTSIKMDYGVSASGAGTGTAAKSLVKYFGYSKGALYLRHAGRSEEEWTEMLQKNLSDYGPMQFAGYSSSGGGHSFVLDGYTDKNYFSINYGWGGTSNGYYLLPNSTYYKSQGATFYLVPDKDGSSEYKSHIMLRAFTTSGGTAYRGLCTNATEYSAGVRPRVYIAIRNEGLVEFYGKICVAHCDKSGNIKKIIYTINKETNPLASSTTEWGYNSMVTISESIEPGDRLLAFYKEKDSEVWVRARAGESAAYEEVLMCATPQEVAKSLKITYKKEIKTLSFYAKQAIQYSITNAKGALVASDKVKSFSTVDIDLSIFEKGKYTLSFASGGEPYTIELAL